MIRHAPRDLEAVRLIANHRFLTRPQLEELLFPEAALTPRSRQVLAWRVLGRLQRDGYVRATSRQVGGAYGGSLLPAYFLTASGLRLAATLCQDLPSHRPARRAAFLAPHSVLTTEIELALRRAARAEPEHEVELWEADWQIAMRLADGAVIPDARVEYCVGTWRNYLFIEADLGTEGTRFFARKMPVRRAVRERHVAGVPTRVAEDPDGHAHRGPCRVSAPRDGCLPDLSLSVRGRAPELVLRLDRCAVWGGRRRALSCHEQEGPTASARRRGDHEP